MKHPIDVVGIGADGWDGLAPPTRRALAEADVLFGSRRQLDAIPESVCAADRVVWPSPMLPRLRETVDVYAERRCCVLASGDPMFHGIGVTLARTYGPSTIRVFTHPSSVSLACARLGWALQDVEIVSVVARAVETVLPALVHGRRVLVLGEDRHTPSSLAELLRRHGFGKSAMTVLEQLGGVEERVRTLPTETWAEGFDAPDAPGALNVIALDVATDDAGQGIRATRNPGLADSLFVGDGQLTKSEVRALTVTALAPTPGELLWDVGGGSGSIAIEWMRTHPRCRAEVFERVDTRSASIRTNAGALGVPSMSIRGAAPESFDGAPTPDAVFVGGGVTQPGLLDGCWAALRPGGRLVANAVTAESEALLLQWYSKHGGTLRRIQIQRGEPLGSFTGWRPQMPVTQWVAVKTTERTDPESTVPLEATP